MNRRSLLKKAGFAALAAPFLANNSLSNRAAAQTDSESALWLVLRGPFLIQVNDSGGLTIVAPVGPNDGDIAHQGAVAATNEALILGQNRRLFLSGVTPSSQPVDLQQVPRLLTLPQLNAGDFTAGAYFTMTVPQPRAIIPTSWSLADVTKCPSCSYYDDGDGTQLASCVALLWTQFDRCNVGVGGDFCFKPNFDQDVPSASCGAPPCSSCLVLRLKLLPLVHCSDSNEQIEHAEAVTNRMLTMLGFVPQESPIRFLPGSDSNCDLNNGSSDDCRALNIGVRTH